MFQNKNDRLIDRFEDWWHRDTKGLPLMWIVARRDGTSMPVLTGKDYSSRYLDTDYILKRTKAMLDTLVYLGDSYAQTAAYIGPGSLAVYLGSEPEFAPNTVWFKPCIDDICDRKPIAVDFENKWWKRNLESLRILKEHAGNDYIVNIPDIVENIDILAALRGTQETLYDLIDEPEEVEKALSEIESTYFPYYDSIYALIKTKDGVTSYYCFNVLGRGKIAKVQCDFSAMISPQQYRRFVLPSLKRQIKRLDHSIYHLDGVDAIRHLPAIMEIEELDALQWTAGAGKPDGASSQWYQIYDQVAAAHKCLWVQIYDGTVNDWIKSADQFINRYGTKACYLLFPEMSQQEAEILIDFAQSHWA